VLKNPQHPYTRGLLKTVPDKSNPDQPLFSIKGNVPSLLESQTNCRFGPRCKFVMDRCRRAIPPLYKLGEDHQAACFLHDS
jgi:oligopeptide/dipeptide ABC transporter ATP-binding protein